MRQTKSFTPVARTLKKPKSDKVLAYDLGGTKVHVAVIDRNGKILADVRVPVAVELGKTGVIRQLGALGRKFLETYPEIKQVGIAAPGPLIPDEGVLLDPTNLSNPKEKGKGWGKVQITRLLEKELGRPVTLENDAAAAMLAERWKGRAKGFENSMILTLGTGLGAGVIVNGKLLRAGRGLHPEAGHIVIRSGDDTAPCGCGNSGCAEGYLAGRAFGRRNETRFPGKTHDAKSITALARKGDKKAIEAFDEYADLMSAAINNYVSLYSPEIVIFAGSFSSAAPLFIPKTKKHLKKRLERRRVGVDLFPQLAVSSLDNAAGVLGGAYVAFGALGIDVSVN